MAYDHHSNGHTQCPACDCHPFLRNAYWTGKLMLARDFVDEQLYVVEKMRHHNQHLHGSGVVCGLKVVAHDKAECRDRFVCIEPGTAVDCCGHDIVLCEKECLDLWAVPEIKKLREAKDTKEHTLQICIRYRECPTEDIPVLYDECGCDDSRCAPNRILESYELGVIILDAQAAPQPPQWPAQCGDLWLKSVDGCPRCDIPDCIVLATIAKYVVGNQIVDPPPPSPPPSSGAVAIDNITGRNILPSVQDIKAVIDCILKQPPGGGGQGPKGDKGDPGAKGDEGPAGSPGQTGAPGPGLESGLTRIDALSWRHGQESDLLQIAGQPGQPGGLGIVIRFDGLVQWSSLNLNHPYVLEALARTNLFAQQPTPPFTAPPQLICSCALVAELLPVQVTTTSPQDNKLITGATQIVPQPGLTRAVALVFSPPTASHLTNPTGNDAERLFVRLRGDWVVDNEKPPRAIDAEFVRASLPTGDRPTAGQPGAQFGIQGGTFESWFTVRRGNQ